VKTDGLSIPPLAESHNQSMRYDGVACVNQIM